MSSSCFHPALMRLLRYRSVARLRRLRGRLASRRRMTLSVLGLVLAVLWLGNAVASVLFRESADPAALARWLPLGFAAYGLWHLIRVAYQRPSQPIEWSAAEQEVFGTAPFTRCQLLTYHVMRICGAAVFKASLFVLLMLPDLRAPVAGFLGALTALLFLELWRLNVEIVAWGVKSSTYRWLRAAVLSCVAAGAATALTLALTTPLSDHSSSWPALLVLLRHLAVSATELQYTPVGQILCAPFELFSSVMLADQLTVAGVLAGAGGLLIIAVLIVLTHRVDAHFQHRVRQREQADYARSCHQRRQAGTHPVVRQPVVMLPWRHGALTLIWRQLCGARQHLAGLLIALAPPAALALLPLIVCEDSVVAYLNVTASLAFYCLVLLPAALRFDFRRDVDRMALLKSLPLPARTIVFGQLAAPVLITSVFQLGVLVTALLLRPVSPGYLVAGWLLLIPMNVVVFALDNLIFLLYPYRPNQEGVEIFLRTTLTFTAKGLLFAGALVVTAAWALLAGHLVRQAAAGPGATNGTRLVFAVGMGLMLLSTALVLARLTVHAFARFDASQDTPA